MCKCSHSSKLHPTARQRDSFQGRRNLVDTSLPRFLPATALLKRLCICMFARVAFFLLVYLRHHYALLLICAVLCYARCELSVATLQLFSFHLCVTKCFSAQVRVQICLLGHIHIHIHTQTRKCFSCVCFNRKRIATH